MSSPHSLPPQPAGLAPGMPLAGSRNAPAPRILLLMALLAGEAALLKLSVYPRADGVFAVPGGLFQPLLYFFLGFFLLLSTRAASLWQDLVDAASDYRWQRLLAPQMASCLWLFFCASRLLPTAANGMPALAWPAAAWWSGMLLAAVALTFWLSLALLAPPRYWVRFVRTEWSTMLLACIFPLSHFAVYTLVLRSEDWLSGPTMWVVRLLLDPVYPDIHADFAAKVIGTSRFDVVIDHLCSGYEGIGMITVFLIWYIKSYSRDFRFPAALLLFPLAAALVWLSNCVRIALLIAIGSSLSSAVAMEGFHANAGWIFFITVALGTVALARRSRFFSRQAGSLSLAVDAGSALAIPFLVLLAATLLSSALSTGFPWLFPVRVLAAGAVIILLWRLYELGTLAPRLFPVLAGALVFLLWLALVPPAQDADRAFGATLFSVPAAWSAAWLALRITGSVLVIPVAEELAFRGYVPLLFRGGARAFGPGVPLQWAPFIVSSLLFGALHSAWLAGMLAGAAYYLVRQRSGRLADSIVAHATTNLLLTLYVLGSGHWSYW